MMMERSELNEAAIQRQNPFPFQFADLVLMGRKRWEWEQTGIIVGLLGKIDQ